MKTQEWFYNGYVNTPYQAPRGMVDNWKPGYSRRVDGVDIEPILPEMKAREHSKELGLKPIIRRKGYTP